MTSTDDATAIEVWGRVINGFQTTNRLLHAKFKARFGLSEAEIETLLNLHQHPDHRAPLNELSRATAFSTGGFTKIADKLTTRELTVRSGCTADRRVTYLQLTETGLKLAAELAAFVAETNRAHVIDVLGADRAQALADMMTQLYRANCEPAP